MTPPKALIAAIRITGRTAAALITTHSPAKETMQNTPAVLHLAYRAAFRTRIELIPRGAGSARWTFVARLLFAVCLGVWAWESAIRKEKYKSFPGEWLADAPINVVGERRP